MPRLALAVAVAFSAVACGGGDKTAAPPSTGAPAAAAPETSPPQPGPASAGVETLIKPKFSDEEYMAAVTALEGANGSLDAAADFGAGRKLVLGIRSTAFPEFPGLTIPRNQIPEDVKIERIAGFVDGSENRHIVRYQMLAQKYAAEYNAAMMRGRQ